MKRHVPDHSRCCANYDPQFKIGDKVVFSQRFLESIAETPTGPLCHAKGIVTGLHVVCEGLTLVDVDWGNYGAHARVNSKNLAKPGTLASMNH